MSIRIFCNVCSTEIKGWEIGELKYRERKTSLLEKNPQGQVVEVSMDLCPKCLKKVKEVLGL